MKDISPQRWSEIESVLDKALDADPSDRRSVVEALAGSDEDLKNSVLALLNAGDQASDFLEESQKERFEKVLSDMVEDEDEGDDPNLNRTVGPYRLIRRLGRGGMGQVYLGARSDDTFDKFVAVKLIRRGMDTEEILQRFRIERRILASLVHPNIARLLDGGATEDGLSYFVMDYVDGTTITDYADRERLSVNERLELFKKVCSAVHHAHQNLIVHRDLKPSNILVDADGEVKLLDFGIAKFLHAEETHFTVPVTREEARVMTPEYASPEQARGEALTTASDVYQLGILLYELLTGTRPYDFSTVKKAEIEKIICETEPERPSTAIVNTTVGSTTEIEDGVRWGTSIDRIRKQLSGDLDRIVLMALRKEADRRYQSADQFLEDINRYLAGLPVHAQSDTWIYRASKFVRRHKFGVAATATVTALLFLVTGIALQSAITTSRQNREIQIALEKKEQVKEMMIGMFEVADPEIARGREITAKELLNRSTERIERELDGQPDVQAEMFHSVGTVYRQLGYLDEARPLLERALEMRRDLYGDSDHEELAQSLFDMAFWYEENGEPELSIDLHEEALAMRQRLFDPPSAEIAESLNELGVVHYLFRDNGRAEELWTEALEMRIALEGPESRSISETLINLAAVLTDEDEYDTAAAYYDRGLAIQRRLLGNDHPFVATTLHNYASLLREIGSLNQAEQFIREAIDLRVQLFGQPNYYVANSLNMLGQILNDEGDYVAAQEAVERALEQHLDEYGVREHPWIGRDLQVLGWSRRGQGDLQGASARLEEAVAIQEASFPPSGHYLVAEARMNLGQIRMDQERFQESETLLRAALSYFLDDKGPESPEVARARLQLGRCLTHTGSYDEAFILLEQSRTFFAENGNPYERDLAGSQVALDDFFRISGRTPSGRP